MKFAFVMLIAYSITRWDLKLNIFFKAREVWKGKKFSNREMFLERVLDLVETLFDNN